MQGIEERIGYTFNDKDILQIALTHSSYANETKKNMSRNARPVNNERLEFLGDSILSVVVADYLYHSCKNLPEGELTRKRAALVCEGALAVFAEKIELGKELKLGKGEEMSGGRQRASILSDAFEALIAAIYLDGGLEEARNFIMPFIKSGINAGDDFKTRLQEVVQQNPEERLRYYIADEQGPDHDKVFTVEVYLNSNCIGKGEGHSKKNAEQQAARQALVLMGLEK